MIRKLIIALVLVGCGGKVKQADDQSHAPLNLPEFEGKGKAPFALTEEQSKLTYKGNLLFWDDLVSPEQVQRVSNASVGGRLVRADYLHFNRDERSPVVKELEQRKTEAVQIDKAIVQSRKDNFDDIVELQEPLLVTWVPARLASLRSKGKISDGDVLGAKGQFEKYCQAKLWQTAVNPLLGRKFASRPTPLIMCESYYEEAKLLDRTSELCKDAPEGRTKSYLDCFWAEGVIKTAMFAARDGIKCKASDPTSEMRTVAVQKWVAAGTLQAALRNEFAAANSLAAVGAISDAVTADKTVPAGLLAPECASAFKGKAGLPVGTSTLLKPLGQILNIVEVSENVLKQFPSNFELLIPSADGSDSDILARYSYMGTDLMTFAARLGGPSVNDRIFNNDATKSVQEALDIRAQYNLAPGFADVRKIEAEYVPDALAGKKAANVKRTQELEAQIKPLEEKDNEIFKRLTDVIGEGASASMAPGVSLVFVSFSLQLTRVEDRIEARLIIRDPKVARGAIGCTTLTGAPCEAARSDAEVSWGSLSEVSFNAEHNELSVGLLLDDPMAQGLIFDAGETKHNLLPVEDLNGRTLRLSAYSNQLQGVLDFFTGKAELIQNGAVEREGSISGDAYDANLAVWK